VSRSYRERGREGEGVVTERERESMGSEHGERESLMVVTCHTVHDCQMIDHMISHVICFESLLDSIQPIRVNPIQSIQLITHYY
jgi:hypothetical protein